MPAPTSGPTQAANVLETKIAEQLVSTSGRFLLQIGQFKAELRSTIQSILSATDVLKKKWGTLIDDENHPEFEEVRTYFADLDTNCTLLERLWNYVSDCASVDSSALGKFSS